MSMHPGPQDGAVPPEAGSDSKDNTATSHERIYDETLIRQAAITEEWEKSRDALINSWQGPSR